MTDPTTPDTLTAAAERAEATTSEWIEAIGLVLDSEAALCDRPGQMARLERAARDLRTIASRLATPAPAVDREDGAALIAAERQRQVESEGWTAEHDDGQSNGELALAALCYTASYGALGFTDEHWPWSEGSWKPTGDRVADLTKAGALLAAEIDRLRRAAVEGGGR